MMWGWPMMGFGGIGMIFGFIFFILIVIGVVLLIIWLVRITGGGINNKISARSLEILKERYAKGELTKEQYESMKKDLFL